MEDYGHPIQRYGFYACTFITTLIQYQALLTFYVQTWEEYHTKTLTLGYVSGPVEGILTICLVFAVTAIKGGGSFWQQSALASLGFANTDLIWDPIYEMTWVDWYLAYGGILLVINTAWAAENVMHARRGRGQKTRVALLGLLPFFTTWTFIAVYLALQPVILNHHLVPFMFFAGLINAYSVGQMITAHLTKSKYPYGNVLMLPLLYGVGDSIGPVLIEKFGVGWPSALGYDTYQVAFVFCCLGLAVGVYGSFVFDVITTICDYLDIWCLTIKHPWTGEEKSNGSAQIEGKKAQ
jgi:ethanolaminephosphotransferase